jgi:plastocyanin domain-containing protein
VSAADWAILVLAVAAIGLVNWYFLFSKRVATAAVAASGIQEATVRVEGGYDPAIIEVDAGRPVRLTFDRRETNPCSEEVVLSAFNIRRELPAFAKTVIEFTPHAPGRYDFACGMGMLHGTLVVK